MEDSNLERRLLLLAPLFFTLAGSSAEATPIDPRETFVLPTDRIAFEPWGKLPPHSGEMAKLYGDLDKRAARTPHYYGVPGSAREPAPP